MGTYKRGRPKKHDVATGRGEKPPCKAGTYRINNGKGLIEYIGETCDLHRRMREHRKTGRLGGYTSQFEYQVADARSSSRTRRDREKIKIRKHAPSGNMRSGGGGRKAR